MKGIGLFLLAVCLALFPAGGEAAPKGRMIVGFGGEPETFDPHISPSSPILQLHPNVFDNLLTIDPQTGEIRPQLAESYRLVSPTVWEFKLRKGARFTNGEPVDARAVKFSLERIRDPALKSRQTGYFPTLARVEVVDEHTVRIHTKTPDAVLDRMLTVLGWIVPPKYYSSHDPGYLSTRPVGSGPYRVVRWKRHEELVLEANPNYWDPNLPRVKTVIVRFIPEPTTRVAALLAGDVEFVEAVPPQMVDRIKKSGKADVLVSMAPRSAGVLMITTKGGPLGDVRVRRALNHAVDVDSIVRNVLQGYAKKVPVFQTERTFGYTEDVPSYPYDPQRAKALLAEAGYPNGFDVDLLVPVGRFFMGREATEAIAGELAKVGVRAQVKPLEWGAMARVIQARHKPEVKPFLYYMARFFFIFDADQAYEGWFHSKSAWGSFQDKEVDRLLGEGRRTTEPKSRAAIYAELNRKIKEKAPMIFLYQEGAIFARSKRLAWEPRVNGFALVKDAALRE